MKRNLGVLVLLLAAFCGGYMHLHKNTDLNLIQRDPAAVRNAFDFSNLQGERLQAAAKQRLLAGFLTKKETTGASFGLGHFVFADEYGERKMACQHYGKVIFTFEAEGVSVAGEKPVMEVEGRCETSVDTSRINPLFIPISKITDERPGDGEFQFNEKSAITVRFTNLPEQWPQLWLMKSMKIINEKNFDSVTVESDEVARYLGHPIVLHF
jgi:hypothetical protein